jgi:uncharacterized Tic20 family protein
MPISVACPTCGTKLKAPDTAVGKKIKCPKCASLIPITEADAGGASAVTDEAPGEELEAVSAADEPEDEAEAPDDDDRPWTKKKKGREGGPASEDDKLWGMLAHLAGALFSWLGALIVFLVKKNESRYLEHHTKEALNFQLTLIPIWLLLLITLCCVNCTGMFMGIFSEWLSLGVKALSGLVWFAFWVGNIIFCALAAMAAKRGDWYRYPVSLRLIK